MDAIVWDRICTCDTCRRVSLCMFKPSDFAVPPNGTWVCADCDPDEHRDYFDGLAKFGAEELGRRSS